MSFTHITIGQNPQRACDNEPIRGPEELAPAHERPTCVACGRIDRLYQVQFELGTRLTKIFEAAGVALGDNPDHVAIEHAVDSVCIRLKLAR